MRSSLRFSQGITLVELMIALALSALLIGLILHVYLSQSGLHHQLRANAELQQSSLVALDQLRQSVLEAAPGKASATSRRVALASPVPQTDHQSRQHQRYDTLVLFYDQGHDCAGSRLDSVTPRWKQFSVVDGELMCHDSDGQALAIVSGVDAFQVRYGMDWHGDGSALQYVPASKAARVEHRVIAIRIGLVLRSESPVLPPLQGLPADTVLLDRPVNAILPHAIQGQSDRRLRRVLEMTVALRGGNA